MVVVFINNFTLAHGLVYAQCTTRFFFFFWSAQRTAHLHLVIGVSRKRSKHAMDAGYHTYTTNTTRATLTLRTTRNSCEECRNSAAGVVTQCTQLSRRTNHYSRNCKSRNYLSRRVQLTQQRSSRRVRFAHEPPQLTQP